MTEVRKKKKLPKGKAKTKLGKYEAPRRLNHIERSNPVPKLSEDIQFLLAERGVTHENLGDISVSIARMVHFAIPNGAMYDASVKLAEFIGTMAYRPPGVDEKAIIRLRKAVKDCQYDWGSLCCNADTVLSIAASDRFKELDQLIFEANNDLIALHEMQKKYARPGKTGITGGNFIKSKLQKLDLEREQLITRFPELVDDEALERPDQDDE